MTERKAAAILVAIMALWLIGSAMAIYAVTQCGWDSVLFGKNTFWAWYFGYC